MKTIRLLLKIAITGVTALLIFFLPMILMVYAAKYAFGLRHLNDVQFAVTIVIIACISFLFSWWLEKRVNLYLRLSHIIDSILKEK